MRSPRVSVVIPCYNLGAYLEEAVESVLAQTFQDFEILVVDDGSTDPETVRVLDRFARPKTTLFRTPNRKLAAARNFLIARARGEFLCALDADDTLHPTYLEKTIAVLEGNPSVGFVSTRLQAFGADTHVWPDDTRCDLETLLCEDPVHCAAVVRRSAVRAVGGYDERMPYQGNEDWDLWISLLEAGHLGIILDDALFFYRRRPGSMSQGCTAGQIHLDSVEYLIRKHATSYRAHLDEVMRRKMDALVALDRLNTTLETEISTSLAPAVERRREELHVLKVRLDEARRDAGAFAALRSAEAAHASAAAEVAALRSSLSWRITAPLRAAYDLLRAASRGGGA